MSVLWSYLSLGSLIICEQLSSVSAGGSFISTNWSQAIFETAISADVISREINALWHNPSSVHPKIVLHARRNADSVSASVALT